MIEKTQSLAVLVALQVLAAPVHAATAEPAASASAPAADDAEADDTDPPSSADPPSSDPSEAMAPPQPVEPAADEPSPTEPTESPPATPTQRVVMPQPPPPEPNAAAQYELRRGKQMRGGGIAMIVIGAVSVGAVALPAWILRKIALDRAEGDPILVDEATLHARAERRLWIAGVSTGLGVGLMAGAIPMLVVGNRRIDEAQAQGVSLRLVPGPGQAGLGVRLRF